MAAGIINTMLLIGGMTCVNCQNRIEKRLKATAGIIYAQVSYSTGTANVTYNSAALSTADIAETIAELGYEILTEKPVKSYMHVQNLMGSL